MTDQTSVGSSRSAEIDRWAVWQDDGGRWCVHAYQQPPARYQERCVAVMPVSEHEEALERMFPATWDGLLAFLDHIYPESVFTGESSDPGPRLIALTRMLARLRTVAQNVVDARNAGRYVSDINVAWGQPMQAVDYLAEVLSESEPS